MAGVPFETVERLATPEAMTSARELAAQRARLGSASDTADKFFQSRAQLLSAEAYHALRVAVRSRKSPVAVAGDQPALFTDYAEAARVVESTESKLDATLQRAVQAARMGLLESSRAFLARYFVFGAEGVSVFIAQQLEKYPRDLKTLLPRNNAARKVEQSLLLYLQRVAAKNDTFSEFGPAGWGRIDNKTSGVTLAPSPGMAAREIFLERWTAHATAAAINSDPAVAAEELLDHPLQVPALEPHAFEVLRDDVAGWRAGPSRDRWLSILESILDLAGAFAAASTQERHKIFNRIREQLHVFGATDKSAQQRFLYSATNPIGEECFRECDFSIGENLINEVAADAAPWIDFWRDSYAFVASRVAGGLRQVFEKAAGQKEAVVLPEFLRACETAGLPLPGPGLVGLAVVAFQEVKAAFREKFRDRMGEREIEFSAGDASFVRQQFRFPPFDEYTYPSADLQIAAKSCEAVGCGEYRWIVSELHPPAALLHHGFYWSCPDKATLNQALARTVDQKPNFHFGFFAADFTAHTTIRIFDALPQFSNFVAPQRANPKWSTIRPADAEVYVDLTSGDVCLRKIQTRAHLGSFARAWVIPLGFHPFNFSLGAHTPRLRCGKVIVQREAWIVSKDELAAGNFTGISRDLVLAVERLRAEKEWPRYVYIRPSEQVLRRSGAEGRDKDTKPVFIDFESYLFLEIFHRWLTKSGELEVTEMLPDPDNLLWRESDGRRTFELRTQIVPCA